MGCGLGDCDYFAGVVAAALEVVEGSVYFLIKFDGDADDEDFGVGCGCYG